MFEPNQPKSANPLVGTERTEKLSESLKVKADVSRALSEKAPLRGVGEGQGLKEFAQELVGVGGGIKSPQQQRLERAPDRQQDRKLSLELGRGSDWIALDVRDANRNSSTPLLGDVAKQVQALYKSGQLRQFDVEAQERSRLEMERRQRAQREEALRQEQERPKREERRDERLYLRDTIVSRFGGKGDGEGGLSTETLWGALFGGGILGQIEDAIQSRRARVLFRLVVVGAIVLIVRLLLS